MLSTAEGGIAQFFDRDAPAEMAKAGMEGFQEFMVQPERLDTILERLERARQRDLPADIMRAVRIGRPHPRPPPSPLSPLGGAA